MADENDKRTYRRMDKHELSSIKPIRHNFNPLRRDMDDSVLLPEYRKNIVDLKDEYDNEDEKLKKAVRQGRSKSTQKAIETSMDDIRREVSELRTLLDDDLSDPQVLNIEIVEEIDYETKLEKFHQDKLKEMTGKDVRQTTTKIKSIEDTSKTFKNLPENIYRHDDIVPETLNDLNTLATRSAIASNTVVIYSYDERSGLATFSTKLGGKTAKQDEVEQLMKATVDYGITDALSVEFNLRQAAVVNSNKDSLESLRSVEAIIDEVRYDSKENISNVSKFMNIMENLLKQKFQKDFDKRALSKNKHHFHKVLNELNRVERGEFDSAQMNFSKSGDNLKVTLDTGSTPLGFTLENAFLTDAERV